ncbi:MAG: CTP-dependent riboflavin kinase [Candidatus Micrarchaeota archaeon]|nr:CTP-dependent riboflavin kinase [Candidatus Micrarchaeota archaeon]
MVSELIFYLLKAGAHKEPKKITTVEVAEALGISQQTASRKLIALEKAGEIVRQGGKIAMTEKALASVRRCVAEAISALEGSSIVFNGKLTHGVGEGAYYCSQEGYVRGFRQKLGFKPFPGTLNVIIPPEEIEKRINLRLQKPIEIDGFKKGNRTFGKIAAYRCTINGLPGAIVFPERSLHGLQVLEVVSEHNLKRKLGIDEGASVRIEVV